MRTPVRLLLALSVAAVFAATALPVSAATQAGIVNCGASPAPYCFSPATLTVPAGTSVTWTNSTGAPHTATADNNAWTTATIAAGTTSGAIAFTTPGTFAYHCAIHSSMHGTVVVTAAVPATAAPRAANLARGGGGPLLPVLLVLGILSVAGAICLVAPRRRGGGENRPTPRRRSASGSPPAPAP